VGAIAGAAISAFFCFGGWWEAGKIAGEVRNPRRTLPIAFTGGVLIVTAYLPAGQFRVCRRCAHGADPDNTAFVAQFGQALFGAAGGRVLSACVVLCVLGGLMVLSMAVPRVTYALAREEAGDGQAGVLAFFSRLASPLWLAGKRCAAADRHGAWRCWAWAHLTASWHSSSFPQWCFWR
jgi:basic amino acid/polyamine antiporter, APA family